MSDNNKLSSRFEVDVIEEELQSVEQNDIPSVVENSNIILKDKLIEKIENIPVWFDYSKEKQKDMIYSFVENNAKDVSDKYELVDKLYKTVNGFGLIQNLIDNEKVDTVFLNGTKTIYARIEGKINNCGIKPSENEFNFIRKALTYLGSHSNLSVDIIDEKSIVIKKIKSCNIENLFNKNFISREGFEFIVETVKNEKNIVIAGAVNSGKTHLLDCIVKLISVNERCVLTEDKSEITSDSDNLVKLLVDKGSVEKVILSSLKLSCKYIFADLNCPFFCDRKGVVFTMRSLSTEDSINKLLGAYSDKYSIPEKSAKIAVLELIDYIIFIENDSVVIAELSPSKTSVSQVKIITDYK